MPPDDSRIAAKTVDVPSPNGNGSIKGYLVRPAGAEKLPAVLVVHENRGLNPYIEDVARRLAIANFIAFAPDGLTSVGGYPGDDEKGADLFKKVDGAKMQADFAAAAEWLKSLPDSTGKLGAIGFCFGGGVVNKLAVSMGSGLDAAVPFYGLQPNAGTQRKSRHRSTRNMRSSTRASRAAGRRSTRRSAGLASTTRGTSTKAPTTASTTTRRRATTRRRRRKRGKERSIGSTNICGLERIASD